MTGNMAKKDDTAAGKKEESARVHEEVAADNAKTEKDVAKTHGEILKQQIIDGQETYDKAPLSILTSSFTAGLEIGLGYLLLCSLYFFLEGKVAEDTLFKSLALVYPFGFILVILGQSILFTEHTSLLALPVLNKKRSVGSLMKLWGLVIAGNLVGGYLMAALLIYIGPKLHLFEWSTVNDIALHASEAEWPVMFLSAILAGWVMGLLSWLVAASKDSISRIVIIVILMGALSFSGLHHSIVGSVEVFAGMLTSPSISLVDYLSFEIVVLLGNAFGGVVFVALLKYRAFVYEVRG